MADNSSKVDNVEVSAPQPQITVTKAEENAESCEKEQSQTSAKESAEKVEAAVEKPKSTDDTKTDIKEQVASVENVSDTKDAKEQAVAAEKPEHAVDTKTDVKEQSVAPRGEAGESQTTILQDWERLQTAIKQPAADTSEHRSLENVEAGQPRAPRRRVPPQRGEEETALFRRWPLGEYWKAILAIIGIILGVVFLMHAHRYLYESPTHEDLVYNAYVALLSGSIAGVIGLFGFYFRWRTCNLFCCCTYCMRFLRCCWRCARHNNPCRGADSENRSIDTAQGDVESQITHAEMDAVTASRCTAESTSTSLKKTTDQKKGTKKRVVFSSPISEDASSSKMSEVAAAVTSVVSETLNKETKEKLSSSRKMSKVAAAVTSVVSETLNKETKEKLTESADSYDASCELSSTDSSSDTLIGSAEIRRRKFAIVEQNDACQSSDEDPIKE